MKLAIGSKYGTAFTGSFETALLWLNDGLELEYQDWCHVIMTRSATASAQLTIVIVLM